LGLNPGPPALEASTIQLGYRGGVFLYLVNLILSLNSRVTNSVVLCVLVKYNPHDEEKGYNE